MPELTMQHVIHTEAVLFDESIIVIFASCNVANEFLAGISEIANHRKVVYYPV